MNRYPRETVELVPLTVTIDGVAATEYQTALVTDGDRPTVWTDAVTIGDITGVMLPGTATKPTTLRIFAKVTSSPEVPVIDMGTIQLT